MSYFCSNISSITSCSNISISAVSAILKFGETFFSSKKLFLTTSKQNESIVQIFALFKSNICFCKFSFSGFSFNFLYIASSTLCFISDAAAFVNVTTNNLSMSTLSFIILFIILSTKTAVFPLPAAAATKILVFFSYIACFCSSVHFTFDIFSSTHFLFLINILKIYNDYTIIIAAGKEKYCICKILIV